MRVAFTAAVVCLGIGCAPLAGAETLTFDVGEAALDLRHHEVVWLSSECSGTLVTPRHVLTAAHCLVGIDALPTVRVSGAWDETFYPVRCTMHPGSFDGVEPRCRMDDREDLREPHDLAVLQLGRPVPAALATPAPIWLTAQPAQWWEGRSVELVGWTRRPSLVGAARRYAGLNRIAAAQALFTTLPRTGARRFTTAPGNSGGPALVRIHGRPFVAGVLSGASAWVADDSGYAILSEATNARWVRAATASAPPPLAMAQR